MSNAANPENTSEVRFGVFKFHPGKLDLSRQDTHLHLQTQPARLLKLLLSRAGELVTRDEIHQILWPDGTTVDFDMAVNRCVRQIREVLGDDSELHGTSRPFRASGIASSQRLDQVRVARLLNPQASKLQQRHRPKHGPLLLSYPLQILAVTLLTNTSAMA